MARIILMGEKISSVEKYVNTEKYLIEKMNFMGKIF